MSVKNFTYFVFIIFFCSSSNNLYAFYEAFEEDFRDSKNKPIISGIDADEILRNGKAAITVCTTPRKGFCDFVYDHVYLVFEIKHLKNPEEINLFSVHFGGDGHSSDIKEGHPIYDDRGDTLIKMIRGRKIDYLNSTDKNNLLYKEIDAIYTKKISFTIEEENAFRALRELEKDMNLQYSLFGDPFGIWGQNTYNCVTYVNRILNDCGIDTKFDSFCYIKNATNFITCCDELHKTRQQNDMKPYKNPEASLSLKNLLGKECEQVELKKKNKIISDTSIQLNNPLEASSNDRENILVQFSHLSDVDFI